MAWKNTILKTGHKSSTVLFAPVCNEKKLRNLFFKRSKSMYGIPASSPHQDKKYGTSVVGSVSECVLCSYISKTIRSNAIHTSTAARWPPTHSLSSLLTMYSVNCLLAEEYHVTPASCCPFSSTSDPFLIIGFQNSLALSACKRSPHLTFWYTKRYNSVKVEQGHCSKVPWVLCDDGEWTPALGMQRLKNDVDTAMYVLLGQSEGCSAQAFRTDRGHHLPAWLQAPQLGKVKVCKSGHGA